MTLRPAATAAILLFAASPGARAQGFSDYDCVLAGCASLQGGALVLDACFDGSCDPWPGLVAAAPLPGTFLVDMHYELESSQSWAQLFIANDSDPTFHLFYTLSCDPQPCSGDVLDIAIPMLAGDALHISLDGSKGCESRGGARCTLDNLRFVPLPGVQAVGGALDAARLFEHTVDAPGSGPLAALGDVDGDGRGDYAVGLPQAGPSFAGQVHIVSGATGALLHLLQGSSGANLGHALGNAGDVDGVDDLVASGSDVRVFSGATGAPIFTLAVPQPGSEFGSSVDGAGDLDADGVPDIVVGAGTWDAGTGDDHGAAIAYSGATQAVLVQSTGVASFGGLGYLVAGAGDPNADGHADVLAGAAPFFPLFGLVRVVSGASGATLHEFQGTSVVPLGGAADGVGDFDGDGQDDVVLGSGGAQVGGVFGFGALRVHSGASGALLFELHGTAQHEQLGAAVAGVGDLDGDARPDFVAGAPSYSGPGRVLAFAAPDGHLLFSALADLHKQVGERLAVGHDLDGDGTPDLLSTARTLLYEQRVLGFSGRPELHAAPALGASGALTAGSPLQLSIAGGPPGGLAVLVMGLSPLVVPFKGGTLLPEADRILAGLPLSPGGDLVLDATWPAQFAAPHVVLVQVWCPEAAAPKGWVASNSLMLAPP
jgi:hypothetical protein